MKYGLPAAACAVGAALGFAVACGGSGDEAAAKTPILW